MKKCRVMILALIIMTSVLICQNVVGAADIPPKLTLNDFSFIKMGSDATKETYPESGGPDVWSVSTSPENNSVALTGAGALGGQEDCGPFYVGKSPVPELEDKSISFEATIGSNTVWETNARVGIGFRTAIDDPYGPSVLLYITPDGSISNGSDIYRPFVPKVTSGNPLVKEKIDIDKEVSRLKNLKQNYLSEKFKYEDSIAKNPNQISQLTIYADRAEQDIALRDKYPGKPVITIKGKGYTKQTDANKALAAAIRSAPKNGNFTKLGTYNGFDIMFSGETGGMNYKLILKGANAYSVEYADAGNNIARFAGVLNRLDTTLANVRARIETLKNDLAFAKEEIKKPFEKETELTEALEKQKDITYRYEHYQASAPTPQSENPGVTPTDANRITSVVKNTIKPEFASNAELMGVLDNKFEGDGINGLVNEIVTRYNNDKSIGDFEKLFTDGGKELYKALSNLDGGTVRYAISGRGEISGEQSGEDILSGNSRRRRDAGTGEQAQRISGYKQSIKGKTKAERQKSAAEIIRQGLIEEHIEKGHKFNIIKPEAYNDDMRSVVENARAEGKDVRIYLGAAQKSFDSHSNFSIDAVILGSKIYLRYDGTYAPQTLLRHEDVHIAWNTQEMQRAKKEILGRLSEQEKRQILSSDRYRRYMKIYNNNKDLVWQEFVADIFAGMNTHFDDNIDIVLDYWYNDTVTNRYNPAAYSRSIDAGGTNASASQSASFHSAGIGRYSFAGERALTANINRLADAKRLLEVDGKSKEFVLKHTGWFKPADGKWRFEIDDSKATISFEKLKSSATLEDVLEHDELYNAYPFLRSIKVKAVDFGKGSNEYGAYNPITNTINISSDVLDTQTIKDSGLEYENTLIHEVQHAIQCYEGFELGGSPEGMIDYLRQQANYYFANIANNARFTRIIQSGTIQELTDFIDNFITTEFHTNSIEEAAKTAYNMLHGEREARITGSRLKMSSGERLENYPDFTKGALLRNDTKKGNSDVRFSKTAKGTSGEEFINLLRSSSGRGVQSKTGVFSKRQGSGVSQKEVKYAIDSSGNDRDFWEQWLDLVQEYGAIPKGENPARDVDVPKKITKDKLVSRFARTMLEAGVTPDTAISEFEKSVLDGTMTHEVVTNDAARDWALKQIKYNGFEEAMSTWNVYTRDGRVGKKELALGMELYNQCITNGDTVNAMKLAAELVAEATHAGQTLQATRMLKRMTPDGQLYYLEKSVQKMNDEFKKKIGEVYDGIELDEDLMEAFLTEKDADARDEIYDDICQNIADQIPVTLLDKWNSWRYLAMLGNPRTHIRNIAGNAVFTPAIRLKNYIGAILERTAKVNESERTKALRKNKDAIEFAEKDFDEMQKVLQGENAKYAVTSEIEGKRTIFKTQWLEKLRTKNFEWLEKEDMWFLKMHYVDALAQILTARGIDVNNIDNKTLDVARAYAIREAQRATYRDANALAEALNKLQKKASTSDKKAVRAASVLLEGVMPFKKTPLNIAKQGIQYSPIGILSGIYKTVSKINKGTAYSTTDIIDDFAKGLTGTALMLLGTFLASLGIISGSSDENKKKKGFDQMVGEQAFSLNVGNSSYTIDWMAPACLTLFTGSELYDLTKDDFKFADIVNALSSLTDPLLELSVFSGISGAIESAQYNDTNTLFAIGSDMTTSYLTQALPTIGGQLSRIIDSSRREYYYTDKNSNLPKGVQSFVGQIASKIPFASYLFEPSIDEWGRKEIYGGVVERIFENTISPGYYSEKRYTKVDKEIKRLYESTGEADVLPVVQQKKYTESKVDYPMTAKQYTEAKQIRGRKSFELIEELLSDKAKVKLLNKKTNKYETKKYSQMSDEEKVRAIKRCYEEAGEETKSIMLEKVKSN